jgi:hypothetical protein
MEPYRQDCIAFIKKQEKKRHWDQRLYLHISGLLKTSNGDSSESLVTTTTKYSIAQTH